MDGKEIFNRAEALQFPRAMTIGMIDAAIAEAYKAGQAAMRERAAKVAEANALLAGVCEGQLRGAAQCREQAEVIARDIRAMPVEEEA